MGEDLNDNDLVSEVHPYPVNLFRGRGLLEHL